MLVKTQSHNDLERISKCHSPESVNVVCFGVFVCLFSFLFRNW